MRRTALLTLLIATTALPARASVELTSFRCGGGGGAPGSVRTIAAMENSYIAGTGYGGCWFHTGHHTYDMGGTYAIGHVAGTLFTVETNFSPPTEIETPSLTNRTVADAMIETSVDGTTWAVLQKVPYNYRIDRQEVAFDFNGAGRIARFLRVRQPRSAAQGLAGFLDSSNFDADLTPVASTPAGLTGFRTFTCAADLMERIFAEHPCWFGGLNRYDSPSVFHTYPIGDAALDRVSGSAIFAPWRTDDYFSDGGSLTALEARVQASDDGVTWITLATISGMYGAPMPFSLEDLGGARASFVRIVAEYMKDPTRHPALKHVRGIVVDSVIQVATV